MAKDLDTLAVDAPAIPDRKPPRVALEQDEIGTLKIEPSGNWGIIQTGAGNGAVASGIATQAALLGSPGKSFDADTANFVLGFVDAMLPKDAAEALLLTQMATIHEATMSFARRLNRTETIRQQDAAERALNKLTRAYTTQMDTLKRYRSTGQQIVRVERVTVQEGGQAIVGNVEASGVGR